MTTAALKVTVFTYYWRDVTEGNEKAAEEQVITSVIVNNYVSTGVTEGLLGIDTVRICE